ncbi:MAG: hypothetical protein ACK5MT_14360, partial [Actinomycetales bacterium]
PTAGLAGAWRVLRQRGATTITVPWLVWVVLAIGIATRSWGGAAGAGLTGVVAGLSLVQRSDQRRRQRS